MSGRPATGGLRSAELVGEDLHLVLNNSLEAIEDGRRELLKFVEGRGLAARVVNRLEVIFEEVVANAIRHGFKPRSGQRLRLKAKALPGQIVLTFEDDGVPFDPLQRASPAAFTTLDEAPVGGLGLPLIRRLSSDLRYERLAPESGANSETGFQPVNRMVVTVSTA